VSWWLSLPVILLAVLVLIVPGLILSLAIRIRGVNSLLLAPAFTVGMAGVLATLYSFLHVPWGPATFLGGVLAVSAAAWAIRYAVIRKSPEPQAEPQRRSLVLAAGLGALGAALLIGVQMATAMISPDSISQTYDNVFHLNAVRWAIDTQDASPLNLGAFTGISAYPAGWHGLVSLVAELSGATIPVAVNATNIAIGSVVWPLGCLYLVQAVAGHRISTTVLAFVFAAGFSTFPILMIDWGVLYPNLLSISVLPAAIGMAFTALNLGRHHRQSSVVVWLSLGVGVAGVALAHPSTLMAFLAFMVAPSAAIYYFKIRRLWPARSSSERRSIILLSAAFLGWLVGLGILWGFLRPPEGSADWGTVETPPQAIGELLFNAPLGRPAQEVISICLLVGLWKLWTLKSRRWLIGVYATAAILFFFAAGYNGSLRHFVTGVWYFDSHRLAALLPVATIAPAVIGAGYLFDAARRLLTPTGESRIPGLFGLVRMPKSGKAVVLSSLAGLTGLVLVTQLGITTFAAQQAHWQYRSTAHSALLSPDERSMLERLSAKVEPGAAIAGLPSSGTALAYAFSGRTVIQPHILTTHGSDVDVVNAGLKDSATFPAVCEAVRKLNVRYVLDFGTRTVTGTLSGYGGVMDLKPNESLELIDSQGPSAKLFKVRACWN
jgi:hypothetical protein